MKKYVLAVITLSIYNFSSAQETIIFDNQSTVITTAVPFLLIASDARAAGMGDMGVATSVDAFPNNGTKRSMPFLNQNLE